MTQLESTLPVRYYTDPSYWETERREIFAKEWQCVGFEYQVERPGECLTEVVANWPIFVQRGSEGGLRAFHNVCPHRAGPIVADDSRAQANLVCRYHGWAFDQDGSLRSARDFGADLPGDVCLTRVQVETWRGCVFVNLDPDAPSLTE